MRRSPLLDWRFHVGASHRFRAGEWDVHAFTRSRGAGRLFVLEDELWLRTTRPRPRVWRRDDVDEVRIRRWPMSDHLLIRRRGRALRRACVIGHPFRDPLVRALAASGWAVDGRPAPPPASDLPARELVEVGRARDWGWVFVTPERVWCSVRIPRGVVTAWEVEAGVGALALEGDHGEIVAVSDDGRRRPRTRALRPARMREALRRNGWPTDASH